MNDKTDREIMQQALDAIMDAMRVSGGISDKMFESVNAISERLAQPAQEPVAVIKRNESGQITMQNPNGNHFDMSKYIGAKLYTAPQKREWQGLFFDAVYEAWHSTGMDVLGGDWNTFASTLEAKLKEKNT